MSLDLLTKADGLRAARIPFVLATVVRAERPTSARPGDRAIVFADGTVEGFVGGACAATTLRVQSAALLTGGSSNAMLLRITPSPEAGPAAPGTVVVDNPCLSGGTLEIFLEAVVPSTLVHVFGDTPIARALVAVGAAAGYDAQAVTDPHAPIPADAAAVVVASHGHDEPPVLRAALAAGIPYVALVASPKRGAAVLAELELPAEQAGRVKTPAGLDIGARTPGEVAVSILAELVSLRGAHLRGAAPPAYPPKGHDPDLRGAAPPADPPKGEEQARSAVPSASSAPTALDPVCGMTVTVGLGSLSHTHAGRTWYFCASGCRAAFVADPARYGA